MTTRQRTTWNKQSNISPAPQLPGYGKEDEQHPAFQKGKPTPTGTPSGWAEDVNREQVKDPNPPQLPGYDKEDQDHPAHERKPRMPMANEDAMKREAAMKAATVKAAKCVDLLEADPKFRAKAASQQNPESYLEKVALDMMKEITDSELDHRYRHLMAALGSVEAADSFLGEEDEDDEDRTASDDEDPDDDDDDDDSYDDDDDDDEDEAMSKMASTNRLAAVENFGLRLFKAMDSLDIGFLTKDQWTGSKKLFAALDHDNDGIIEASEFASLFLNAGLDDMNADPKPPMDEKKDLDAPLDAPKDNPAPEMDAKLPTIPTPDAKEGCGGDMMAPPPVNNPQAPVVVVPPTPMMDPLQTLAEDTKNSPPGMTPPMTPPNDVPPMDMPSESPSDNSMLDDLLKDDSAKQQAMMELAKGEDHDLFGVSDDEFDPFSDEHSEEDPENERAMTASLQKLFGETVNLKPQPKKASQGETKINGLTKTAGDLSVNDLSRLWTTAPDISPYFNTKKR